MAKLSTYVTVYDDQGNGRTFGPRDDLPGWAEKKITNPDVWDGALPGHIDAPQSDDSGAPDGRASREKWVDYARSKGASDAELAPESEGGLSKADLRDKYSS